MAEAQEGKENDGLLCSLIRAVTPYLCVAGRNEPLGMDGRGGLVGIHRPAEGQVVSLDSTSILFYQHIIRYEQKKKLSLRDKLVYLGDSLIREYRFRENYYFVSGDNMENSRDSRYWGLLPESYIVGKATRIWKSEDPADGHIRWDRVWKGIK